MFKPVPTKIDFPAMERETLQWWREQDMMQKYLRRNQDSPRKWSFIDGPITANNPMGVHHAWGRTYKDLYQRFKTMQGFRQRYQNGFDCQGLWIEVEVERELGFKSKRDIEEFGIARFVEECKERVRKFAGVQTEQSIRLGYWMDWDNSYYTMSDENNYTIWHVLKSCHERGWIYKGHDVMPWCPRCATGLSQHEIVTEGYRELTHPSVYVRLPLTGRENEYLLVWTTTPWTLSANVAAAVHPELTYVRVRQGSDVYYLAKAALGSLQGEYEVLGELRGEEMLGWTYRGPFDELPRQQGVEHRVIPWEEVSETEGTGIVHIAPGCGKEDFELGKEFGLAVIAPLDEDGVFLDGYGWLSGRSVSDVAQPVFDDLQAQGHPLSRPGLHAPLPGLLALRQRARLPPRRRVVHLDGRAAGPHRRGDEEDPLDPGVRPGARARLAPEHGRLDDLQEALLGPGAADLRVRVRQRRGHRQRGRAAGARRRRAGTSSTGIRRTGRGSTP